MFFNILGGGVLKTLAKQINEVIQGFLVVLLIEFLYLLQDQRHDDVAADEKAEDFGGLADHHANLLLLGEELVVNDSDHALRVL